MREPGDTTVGAPSPAAGGHRAIRALVGFPDEVDDVAARTVASGVVVAAVAAIATRQAWVAALLAYGFVARVVSGPRLSPLAQVATRVVAPRLAAHRKLLPGPPKRFAQSIGAVVTLAATGCWLAGEPVATFTLLAALALPALAEAALGFCVGCQAFALLMRAGLVPEAACEACADLFGPAASRRRAASQAT